jgi:hypothetical protein
MTGLVGPFPVLTAVTEAEVKKGGLIGFEAVPVVLGFWSGHGLAKRFGPALIFPMSPVPICFPWS